jgi:hypothetical protein
VTAALWIDAANGAAGDMLVGALIDAGAPQAAVEHSFAALSRAAGEQVSLQVSVVRRHGLKASLATVVTAPSRTRRTLPDVLAVLTAADLGPAVTGFAARVFGLLADAEGQVHGVPAAEVHFHEVGALDALADVSGCAVALDALGLLGDSQPGRRRQRHRPGRARAAARPGSRRRAHPGRCPGSRQRRPGHGRAVHPDRRRAARSTGRRVGRPAADDAAGQRVRRRIARPG